MARHGAHQGRVLGYDPWLHTPHEVERFRGAAEKAGPSCALSHDNPLDRVWPGQPAAPIAPVVPHPEQFAGESARVEAHPARARLATGGGRGSRADDARIDRLAAQHPRRRRAAHAAAAVICDPAAGRPVSLFIDRRKLVPGLERHLGNAVDRHAARAAGTGARRACGGGRQGAGRSGDRRLLGVRPADAAGAKIHRAADPCLLPKACKNAAEIDGTRAAHRRDGAALTRFLAWLAREAPKGELSEIAASDRLEAFRREGEYFRDLSFPTISGAGSNGAIVHYRAMPETEKRLEPGTLYLLDSGAQYLDGTTDVTRTIAVGEPSAEMRDRFTRVLKGHIALALARFPRGTTGTQLDGFARRALWQEGLDYDHGTGHGVGSYLGGARGPAAHLQGAEHAAAAARHDRLQRARLL